MSFLRNPQIYPPIWCLVNTGDGPLSGFAPGSHRLDESAAGYSLAGCAPAEPASASPGDYEYAVQSFCWSRSFHPTANSVLTVCVSPGGKRIEYLRTYVRQLRKKLEDDPAEPKYLLTDTCYGYRFRDVTVDTQ